MGMVNIFVAKGCFARESSRIRISGGDIWETMSDGLESFSFVGKSVLVVLLGLIGVRGSAMAML